MRQKQPRTFTRKMSPVSKILKQFNTIFQCNYSLVIISTRIWKPLSTYISLISNLKTNSFTFIRSSKFKDVKWIIISCKTLLCWLDWALPCLWNESIVEQGILRVISQFLLKRRMLIFPCILSYRMINFLLSQFEFSETYLRDLNANIHFIFRKVIPP